MPTKLAAGIGAAGFVFGPFADVPQLVSAERDSSGPGADEMTPMISPPPASGGPTPTTASPEAVVGPAQTTAPRPAPSTGGA
jgi:hypothetical protein